MADGAVTLIDFMPPRGDNSDVVRMVCGGRGRVAMRMELVIRFGYGRIVPWVRKIQDNSGTALEAMAGPDMVVLHTPVPVRGENMHTVAEFEISEGQVIPFVLTYGASHAPTPKPINPLEALEQTRAFWTEWSQRCCEGLGLGERLGAEVSDAVVRSLITLKALTYAPTGGIVAAATTSLPETIGGARNWDYRFCWLRDATVTLLALMDAGYYEEAQAWRDWLLRAVAGSPEQIQIMYGIAGERRLTEWEVPWLPGYEGSRPVRIGNAAHDQLQLDVFGEVMDALHQARRGGLAEHEAAWALRAALLDAPGDRSGGSPTRASGRCAARASTSPIPRSWLGSRSTARIRSAEDFGLPRADRPLASSFAMRSTTMSARTATSRVRDSFVQAYGSKALDASLCSCPACRLPAGGRTRAMAGTVAADRARAAGGRFPLRYDTGATEDGLPAR